MKEKIRRWYAQTYHDIYQEDDGTRSNAWDVMKKMMAWHRTRCTRLYGL